MLTDPTADPSEVSGAMDENASLFGLMALGIVGFALDGAAQLSLAALVIGFLSGKEPSVTQGIANGIRRFFGYVGMILTQGCLLAVVAIPGLTVLARLVFASPPRSDSAGCAAAEAI